MLYIGNLSAKYKRNLKRKRVRLQASVTCEFFFLIWTYNPENQNRKQERSRGWIWENDPNWRAIWKEITEWLEEERNMQNFTLPKISLERKWWLITQIVWIRITCWFLKIKDIYPFYSITTKSNEKSRKKNKLYKNGMIQIWTFVLGNWLSEINHLNLNYDILNTNDEPKWH